MALHIVRSKDERLVSPAALECLREIHEASGRVIAFAPSFAQALDIQKTLAAEKGLALDVTSTTLESWVEERWRLYGDGTSFIDATTRIVLMRSALVSSAHVLDKEIDGGVGTLGLLCDLASEALAWIPFNGEGELDAGKLGAMGLTHSELCALDVIASYSGSLGVHGLVEPCCAMRSLPQLLSGEKVLVNPAVLVGFSSMTFSQQALVRDLARLANVTIVIRTCSSPAFGRAEGLASELVGLCEQDGIEVTLADEGASVPRRSSELSLLLDALFKAGEEGVEKIEPTGSVSLLEPAGPAAENELVAEEVKRLASQGMRSIVICSVDVPSRWRFLAPKIAAGGISVRACAYPGVASIAAYHAFMDFASVVAHLSELNWPDPRQTVDGLVPQLGNMEWWPPRELVDFMLSDISDVAPGRAWALDRSWRGDRLLTPASVLATLQRSSATSALTAAVTADLLKGRIGSAATRLRVAVVERDGDAGDEAHDPLWLIETSSALGAIAQVASSLRSLGMACDIPSPSSEDGLPLSVLISLIDLVASRQSVSARAQTEVPGAACEVSLMSPGQVASLAPCSADALIYLGLDTAHSSLSVREGSYDALLCKLGVQEQTDPLQRARESFHGCLSVPRSRLVLERCINSETSDPTFPAVMLSELLACYGFHFDKNEACPLASTSRGEDLASENLSLLGSAPASTEVPGPAPAGQISDAARPFVIVPRDGLPSLPDDVPSLSASQIETYLECPYKWFTLRRLGLESSDAGFGNMEMGTFAHRVLEVTHRTLLDEAVSAMSQPVDPEREPAAHIPGSRVDDQSLAHARDVLNAEFDSHLDHQYQRGRKRADQALVPHLASEGFLLDELRQDLGNALAFEAGRFVGFEPRFFEQRFGGSTGTQVTYAGADFVGTIDRIDVDAHGRAIVIDYKHKKTTGEYYLFDRSVPDAFILPRHVQALIYAQVVRRAFPDLNVVGAVYFGTRTPQQIAGALDANVVEQVYGYVPRNANRMSVPGSDVSSFNELLDRSEELIASAIARMMSGDIEANPLPGACEWCRVSICEKREG